MAFDHSEPVECGDLLGRAQAGDPDALAALRAQYHSQLTAILLTRGASPSEAEHLLADLWSDCVPGVAGRPSLLQKYHGKSPLLPWLARVVRNRFVTGRIRDARLSPLGDEDPDLPLGWTSELVEDGFTELLRECVKVAFASCPARELVMLRLVHMHGLTQREAGTLFGWGESRTSRALEAAMAHIRDRTLREVRRRDPRLELKWEDFLGMCEQGGAGFL